ncbi:MAG: glycosyltransferase family 4 protein [Acutalibacteraceae bacterium]|nr:glycosyltransferase family 4 protein [Acutalibacteraceae bacterium]
MIVSATTGFIKGFLLHDIELLQKFGYQVHCAANSKNSTSFDAEEFFKTQKVTFHNIEFSSVSPFSRFTIKSAKQIKKLLKKEKFDVIHCHTPIAGIIVRIMAASYRKKGCKIIYTTHGLAFPKGSGIKEKLVYGMVELLGSALSDAIITINNEDFCMVKKMLCKKVYYINGVGVQTSKYHNVKIDRALYREKIGVGETDIMVLSVGELSDRKNHQIIIKALAELNDPQFVFVICGKIMTKSDAYENLVKLANELNVKVKFLGFRTDIPEITHCADIAVLPSKREGLGLAGIEALASGIPVVGSRVQGIKDYVIDGKTGFLCSPTNHCEFSEKIKMLSNPNLRESMRNNCIKKAEEFSVQVSWKQMEDIYIDMLN